MSEAAALLRMLEPVVRPGQLPGPNLRPPTGSAPIETRSFEDLLVEARQMNEAKGTANLGGIADGAAEKQTMKDVVAELLGPLAKLDAVENTSLRELIDQRGGSTRKLAENTPPQAEP